MLRLRGGGLEPIAVGQPRRVGAAAGGELATLDVRNVKRRIEQRAGPPGDPGAVPVRAWPGRILVGQDVPGPAVPGLEPSAVFLIGDPASRVLEQDLRRRRNVGL